MKCKYIFHIVSSGLIYSGQESIIEGRHFADGIFKYIFLNENQHISIKISLKFVDKGPIEK